MILNSELPTEGSQDTSTMDSGSQIFFHLANSSYLNPLKKALRFPYSTFKNSPKILFEASMKTIHDSNEQCFLSCL